MAEQAFQVRDIRGAKVLDQFIRPRPPVQKSSQSRCILLDHVHRIFRHDTHKAGTTSTSDATAMNRERVTMKAKLAKAIYGCRPRPVVGIVHSESLVDMLHVARLIFIVHAW
jgi:hypothetical protein